MAMPVRSRIDLPLDVPCFSVRSTLSGRDYIISLDYNQRIDRWYLHLHDVNDVSIARGAKLVTNWPLFRQRRWDPRMPAGTLIAATEKGLADLSSPPPGLYDLGRRVFLWYYESIP